MMPNDHDGQGAMPDTPETGAISRPASLSTISDDDWSELPPAVQRAVAERETRFRANISDMGQRWERKFNELSESIKKPVAEPPKKGKTIQDISDDDLDAYHTKVSEMLYRARDPEDTEAREYVDKIGPSALPAIQKELARREASRAVSGAFKEKETEWSAQAKRDATLNTIRAECGSDSLKEGNPVYERAKTVLSSMGDEGRDINNPDVLLLAFRLAKAETEQARSREAAKPRRDTLDVLDLDDESYGKARARMVAKKGGNREAFEADLLRFVSGR